MNPKPPVEGPDPAGPTVYVIDDDESIRELLGWLMKRNGIRAESFPNAKSFLKAYKPGAPGCLVLDLYMPGMSGLDLQRYLIETGIEMPVIFLSGRADVPKAVLAVKSGAIDFIEKPFDYRQIVDLVRECLLRDAQSRAGREEARARANRLATLTQREREVLAELATGKSNSAIAGTLYLSERAVEKHSNSIFAKLGLNEEADVNRRVKAVLVHLAATDT